MRVWAAVLAISGWLCAAAPAAAEPLRTPHVETELHAARAAIQPGERFTIVLRQTIREHWHTYWINPGAAGEPTEIEWRLPPGFSAGPIRWPTPTSIQVETLINYGYSGEVLLPVEITAPANLRPGARFTLAAHVTWVVCSDICVFEEGDLALTLPVAAQPRDEPRWGPRIAAALAALPTPFDAAGALRAHVTAGEPALLSITFPGETLREPYFFPYSRDAINPSAPQNPSYGARGVSFDLAGGVDPELGRARLGGLFTFTDSSGKARGYEIFAEPGPPLPDTSGARQRETPGMGALALLAALGLAFLGGLILNIMPCVLPVLSMKALSFAGGAHSGQARRHGLLYLAGVLATFLVLAGLLIALRGGGAALGWGFQLQAPWVTSGLALLFFAIGLNLVGVFSVGGGVQNAGAGLTARGGDLGAFFTGALAVVAATPCTAPFMAGAIGAVLTQSAPVTLLIFIALALGFALPMTALSFTPALQRLIPKPGPWMERARNVLAFPMFAAAVWLAWVLTEQTGAMGVLGLLSLAAALAFALFVARWGRMWLIVGLVGLALTAALAWRPLLGLQTPPALASEAWTPARVEALRAEGRPVLVNFTAAWCATCKLNEWVFDDDRVVETFTRTNTAYLKADWTRPNPDIAAVLARLNRAGIPVYLYYPPGDAAPTVLPLDRFGPELVIDNLERGTSK